jgi:hypothetical protein
MPGLIIDGKPVDVPTGATVLEAARKLGIDIPTLCFAPGFEAGAGCMVCAVRIDGKLRPSCATVAREGMVVESETADIMSARRQAAELILRHHAGDCEAPCQTVFPTGLHIPAMLRLVAAGKFDSALELVLRETPLLSLVAEVEDAPYERACRRAQHDGAVNIGGIVKHLSARENQQGTPSAPACREKINRKALLNSPGATGLAAAYFLLREGVSCAVCGKIQELPFPGDMAREIRRLEQMGLETTVGSAPEPDVIISPPESNPAQPDNVFICREEPNLFACLRAGRKLAGEVLRYLKIDAGTFSRRRSVHLGSISPEEMAVFLKNASAEARTEFSGKTAAAEISREAKRCLHCDCRAAADCRLREVAEKLGASFSRHGDRPFAFAVRDHNPRIIYEPGKCIACGLCEKLSEKNGVTAGLCLVGRGLGIKAGMPLDDWSRLAQLAQAEEYARVCPAGALALRD